MTRMLKKAFAEASQLTDAHQDAIAQLVLAELKALYDQSASPDPFLRAHHNAPVDDEPVTNADLAALREGLEDLAQGRTLTQEEIRRQFSG